MATLVSVVKERGLLTFTYDDGRVLSKTITYADAMVSTPPPGYEEVGNCYIDSLGRLVLNYNSSSITIDPTGGAPEFGEIRLTPKASSSGAEGTVFYDMDDNHLWVATV